MPTRRNPRLRPQIQASQDGAGVTRRRSPRLHPQIRSSEEGAGVIRRRRRSRGTSATAAGSLPDGDDMLREILLRLPPQPSSLPRASAVCKRWRCIVGDPKFQRQFRGHHRKPSLLGLFTDGRQGIVFTPILDPPDRIPPQRLSLGRCSNGVDYRLLDCRHGLVLVQNRSRTEVLVCDPITGEQRCVAVPSELRRGFLKGAVLCAAGDHGHVHGGCHLSSYKVVLLSTVTSHFQCLACVYSSETGLWGNLISTMGPLEIYCADDIPATLIGNCLYWSKGDYILEFDLDGQNLDVIDGYPVTNDMISGHRQIIQAADGAIGYAVLSFPRLEMWQRNISARGVATWVLWKTTQVHTILGLPTPHCRMGVQLLGYDEDDVLFLCYDGNVYMLQLKSMRSRVLDGIIPPAVNHRYLPFKSFLAPGRTIAGGFNGAEMLNIG